MFFPNTYELIGEYISEDAIVLIRGRIDRRDDQPRLMAMDLSLPDLSRSDDSAAASPDVVSPATVSPDVVLPAAVSPGVDLAVRGSAAV
ncbi:MAG TPA: hypothetical protein VGJ28_02510, partial [Micromonosporaceae bacterium]